MKVSAKAAVRAAVREDAMARKLATGQGKKEGKALLSSPTMDSFINFAHKLGLGADNALSGGTYGFNPVTRVRVLLEWIHRGSWLGGVAIDLIADDMTRKGIEFTCEVDPDDYQAIEQEANRLGFWEKTNETIKWSRLYGGSVGVMLIDGQDLKTPLNLESVGKDQFKGVLPLDRWMVEPSLEDLVTEYGPHLGMPKYYRVLASAPALRGAVVHHSRLSYRLVGIKLPYQQALTENLWGISVLERLYDRMIAFDSATTGAAQLVFKAYLRTLKIDGLRDIVAAGGAPLHGLMTYTDMMRRFQGQEGITLLDLKDEFELQQTSAFSSIDSVLMQLGQQLSGALQIPLVRLFGQSPSGLNSTGESDIRTYYDEINKRQETDLREGVLTSYKLIAQSKGIKLPDDFDIRFASLWDLDDVQKAEVASKTADAVAKMQDAGNIGRKTALQELRTSSRRTGIFTHIDQATIDSADDEVMPPASEQLLGQAGFGEHPLDTVRNELARGDGGGEGGKKEGGQKLPTEDSDGTHGSHGQASPMDRSQRRRASL